MTPVRYEAYGHGLGEGDMVIGILVATMYLLYPVNWESQKIMDFSFSCFHNHARRKNKKEQHKFVLSVLFPSFENLL